MTGVQTCALPIWEGEEGREREREGACTSSYTHISQAVSRSGTKQKISSKSVTGAVIFLCTNSNSSRPERGKEEEEDKEVEEKEEEEEEEREEKKENSLTVYKKLIMNIRKNHHNTRTQSSPVSNNSSARSFKAFHAFDSAPSRVFELRTPDLDPGLA